WNSLRRVIPDLTEADVVKRFLFRERYVQPVPVLNYSELVPPVNTGISGLLLANTTQIINDTLNNNAMVRIARRAVARVADAAADRPQSEAVTTSASMSA